MASCEGRDDVGLDGELVRGEPVRLYYAFEDQPAANTIQPYLFAGMIKRIEKTDQHTLGRFTKVVVDFGEVTP